MLETKKLRIFNPNPLLPGRHSDPPGREMVYGVPLKGGHAPSHGQPMHDLPTFATWGQFMTTLISQIISVDLHTMVAAYIWSNTEDVKADHRDLVRGRREGGGDIHDFYTRKHGSPFDPPQPFSLRLPKRKWSPKAMARESYANDPRAYVGIKFTNGACAWRLSR